MTTMDITLLIAFGLQTVALSILSYRNHKLHETVDNIGHFVMGLTEAIRLELQEIKEKQNVYSTID